MAKVQTNPVGRKTQRDDAVYLLDLYLREDFSAPKPAGMTSFIPRKMQITVFYFIVKAL